MIVVKATYLLHFVIGTHAHSGRSRMKDRYSIAVFMIDADIHRLLVDLVDREKQCLFCFRHFLPECATNLASSVHGIQQLFDAVMMCNLVCRLPTQPRNPLGHAMADNTQHGRLRSGECRKSRSQGEDGSRAWNRVELHMAVEAEAGHASVSGYRTLDTCMRCQRIACWQHEGLAAAMIRSIFDSR